MKAIWLAVFLFTAIFILEAIHYTRFESDVKAFTAKGPRFTAQDGQALCERVAKLEPNPQPCRYGGK